jgi:hypothetical protein
MKNIHILPTDKPSRLFLNKVNNKLLLDSDTYCDLIRMLPSSNYQNIYITSDEEIKEGDWIKWGEAIYKANKKYIPPFKKIILTTDQDLIKDGVQAIDDEFLEWFVKNPSCEDIEVKKEQINNKPGSSYSTITIYKYKIIIPQEEQMAHNGLNGLTPTAVEWLVEKMLSQDWYTYKSLEYIKQAKEMEIKQAHEYAEFAIRCDRKDMKILNFDGYINLENTEQ